MSVAVNYYLGIARGKNQNPGNVLISTTPTGTAADVEVRLQIDNGTTTTGLTKDDAILALRAIEHYILGSGIPGGQVGTDLPAL